MFDRYLKFIEINHRWVVLLSLCFSLLLAAGMGRLGLSSDFRVYFSDDNPQLKIFDALEAQFSKMDNLWIFTEYNSASEDLTLFDQQGLSVIESLTRASWQLAHVIRVSSLTNYQHTEVEGDELWVNFLVEGAQQLLPEQITRIKQVAESEPSIRNNVISPDGRASLIQIRLALPDEGVGRIKAGQQTLEEAR